MDLKIILIGILCAINLVHADQRRRVLTVVEAGHIEDIDHHRRVIRDTSQEKGVQLRISEPISNNNITIGINKTTHGATESVAVSLTTTISPHRTIGPIEEDSNNEFTTEPVSNETASELVSAGGLPAAAVTGFPFNAHESLTAPIDEGQSDDGVPPGAFIMLNATCNENEDPNCIIDHNITCVGDPSFCNLTYEEYMELLNDYIYPSMAEWILIISHAVVFIMGLVSLWIS